MENEQILKQAIEKAEANGFSRDIWNRMKEKAEDDEWQMGLYDLIFSHDFAKAFWGEEATVIGYNNIGVEVFHHKWAYHLKQMVLEKEPLKYIAKHI